MDVAILKSGTPISQLMRNIDAPHAWCPFELEKIANVFDSSGFHAIRFLRFGTHSLVFELADGELFKISPHRRLTSGRGTRPFDLPILLHGFEKRTIGSAVQWYVQPKAQTPVFDIEVLRFAQRARLYGYRFTDAGPENLGHYRGEVYLLDPWAV